MKVAFAAMATAALAATSLNIFLITRRMMPERAPVETFERAPVAQDVCPESARELNGVFSMVRSIFVPESINHATCDEFQTTALAITQSVYQKLVRDASAAASSRRISDFNIAQSDFEELNEWLQEAGLDLESEEAPQALQVDPDRFREVTKNFE